jgi:hypothetical protein
MGVVKNVLMPGNAFSSLTSLFARAFRVGRLILAQLGTVAAFASVTVVAALALVAALAPVALAANAARPNPMGRVEAPSAMTHQLIRRIAVFPLQAPSEFAAAADEAWWQAREELTKSQRFLVASKQFLLKSDAFQPRGELEPADAILLGKLLDAHAVVSARLEGRRLLMVAYDGGNGVALWRRELALNPAISIQDQLASAARRAAADFAASFPYQAYQVVDPLNGTATYAQGDKKLAQVELGAASGAQVGDAVQWIRLTSESLRPLFQSGGKIEVYAEGRIVGVEGTVATVEILRQEKGRAIKEYDLVRLPREQERRQKLFAIKDGQKSGMTPDLLTLEAAPMENMVKERRPLVAVASWVGSLAVFLLLAF